MSILGSSMRRARACLAAVALVLAGGVAIGAVPASAAASAAPGTYRATTPTRVLDTRTGAYGNRKGAVRANGATNVRVVGSSGVPTSAAAVAVTISVVSAARSGGITASTYGVGSRPRLTSVQFGAGKPATDLAIVRVTSGRIKLWNASDGRVQLVADVVGYYVGGTPTVDGALHLRTAKRVVDTRTGLNGFHKGALRPGATLTAHLHTLAGLPSDAGAVAATVTVFDPRRAGSLIGYAGGTTRPSAPLVEFSAGHAVSQFGVLPISDIQTLSLHNTSSGSVQVVIDVVGYLKAAPAAVAHGVQVVAANRSFADGFVPRHGSDVVPVLGRAGVPKTGVAAVAVSVRISKATRAGTIVASKGRAPVVVSFHRGARATGQAILHVVNGAIRLRNTSGGSLALEVDAVGYVPSSTITAPTAKSVARYPNDLTANVATDSSLLNGHGQTDAANGATFALLDLGAQTITSPLSSANPGIALTLTSPTVRISYPDLVTDIKAYIDGIATGGRHVTLAVATNNGGDWTAYTPRDRGRQFANLLIDPLASYGAAHNVTVLGANDIESIFGTGDAGDAIDWESAYFNNTAADLVFNGALVGCPTVFGSTASCAFGWTQADYVALTRHVVNGDNRVQVLPQIYFPVQAVQWANIFARSGNRLHFIGSLTQHGADAGTFLPRQGWAALVRALQWRVTSPSVPRAVDIAPAA
jgi:hypothetical protein